ncbi:hypothetical protein Vadar_012276 [Vaccinium darrowii]|uniref:Uncharacterized protein n=1 Tax=Vaccinium darrowii TaxID=229202 RepID=A0ACB7XQZ4_9ERIC|nr:hypothetical protein Vadar_012276 [Vaccinium darrowii]
MHLKSNKVCEYEILWDKFMFILTIDRSQRVIKTERVGWRKRREMTEICRTIIEKVLNKTLKDINWLRQKSECGNHNRKDTILVQAASDSAAGEAGSPAEQRMELLIVVVAVVAVLVIGAIIYVLVGRCYRFIINRRVVNSFRVVNYPVDAGVGFGQIRCSICLEDYTEGVRVSVLPCRHIYHPDCLQKGTRPSRAVINCPDCRRQHALRWWPACLP